MNKLINENHMLNIGVIGVGSMGRNHARVLAELPYVNLAAVADIDTTALYKVARTYRARPYTDYRDMLDEEPLDVVSLVVPTALHYPIAKEIIERGIHVFVEKPFTLRVEEGKELIAAAAQKNVKLGVGHIERFNPAVVELKRRLEHAQLGRVYQIHARRVGPFPPRVDDVGVILDLATHELDIMEYITGSSVSSLYAETERKIHASHEDLLLGVLKFENGTVGVLDINWLTPTKIRELALLGERGMFLVNYLTQDFYFYENAFTNGQWEGLTAIMGVSEGRRIKYEIKRREPLRVELEDFVNCVLHGGRPAVTGEEALRAVFLAEKMIQSGETGQVIHLLNGERRP
ncbi:MAG: Gfo/Idh/MocA family oxidoreductase [Anaerolineae bacterium]|nr:Gfo/Idh/MocA family oxidoreductase [Anaerolineae bacterium]